MKKHSRSLALLLGIFILFSAVACSGGGNADTSAAESTDSRAPETTDIFISTTTEEPSVTVSGNPETTQDEITTDEITSPPTPEDTIKILMQKDRGEAVTSMMADEEHSTLLDERAGRLLNEHLLDLSVIQTDDIVSKVKNDVSTSTPEYDLLLILPEDGIELLTSASLENLSEAGIGITPESAGIRKSITESISVGGGAYLLSCDALVSDLTSAYTLAYNGAALSSDPVTIASSGEFTAEIFLTYIAELKESAFSFTAEHNVALYTSLGGNIFVKDEKGLPISALSGNYGFKESYTAASALASAGSDKTGAVFTLTKLRAARDGEIFLPLPKLSAESEYSTLLDASTTSLLAAPAGVVSGGKLASFISAFNMSSSLYRDSVRKNLTEKSGARGEIMLGIIERSARLDLGILLGWGDIDDLISDGMASNTSADAILSDRITAMRNKAVATASGIVGYRLGIE